MTSQSIPMSVLSLLDVSFWPTLADILVWGSDIAVIHIKVIVLGIGSLFIIMFKWWLIYKLNQHLNITIKRFFCFFCSHNNSVTKNICHHFFRCNTIFHKCAFPPMCESLVLNVLSDLCHFNMVSLMYYNHNEYLKHRV